MKSVKLMIGSAIGAFRKNTAFSAFVGLVVSMSMIITASLAWFTMNRRTGVDDLGMSLTVDDTVAVYNVYMYDLEKGEGTDKNADGSKLNIANLDLNQYDTIFKVYNKYTPAFAKIELLRNTSMPKNGTVYITITRNDQDKTALFPSAFSSSVLRFTGFVVEDKADLAKTTPDDLYSFINDSKFRDVETYLNNDGVDRPHSATFVDVVGTAEDHTHQKTNSITIEVTYTEDAWYFNDDGAEVLNVYLYMTYDVQLIKCYMDETTGDNLTLGNNTVFFDNDLEKISVSYINDED